MACGCSDNSCSCVLTGGTNVTVSGGGTAGNPFVINSTAPTETTFAATVGDGLSVTPGGTHGHTPTFDLVLDPDSPAALSVGADGLSVACCSGGGGGGGMVAFATAPQTVIGDGATTGTTETDLGISLNYTGDGVSQYLLTLSISSIQQNLNHGQFGYLVLTLYDELANVIGQTNPYETDARGESNNFCIPIIMERRLDPFAINKTFTATLRQGFLEQVSSVASDFGEFSLYLTQLP